MLDDTGLIHTKDNLSIYAKTGYCVQQTPRLYAGESRKANPFPTRSSWSRLFRPAFASNDTSRSRMLPRCLLLPSCSHKRFTSIQFFAASAVLPHATSATQAFFPSFRPSH
ncbi:hypothetical protein [Burkholderia ubonensis]|uniref:hypothetical protein n=1 Tax=Burkholderia ubonensis TaxID=101571 RepID=UPI0012F70A4C|nr:hypothetical protein [Burkholderia ubonensis]